MAALVAALFFVVLALAMCTTTASVGTLAAWATEAAMRLRLSSSKLLTVPAAVNSSVATCERSVNARAASPLAGSLKLDEDAKAPAGKLGGYIGGGEGRVAGRAPRRASGSHSVGGGAIAPGG